MAVPIWIKYSYNSKDNVFVSLDQPTGIKFYGSLRIKQYSNEVYYLEGCSNRKWTALGRVEKYNRYRQWFSIRSYEAFLLIRERKKQRQLDIFIMPGKIVKDSVRKSLLIEFMGSWAPD